MEHPDHHSQQEQTLHGSAFDLSDPQKLKQAVLMAVDYRGDVTVTLVSTGKAIEGYMFDFRVDRQGGEHSARLIPRNSDERVTIRLSDIKSLEFTGKDTASGKTFENWIRKYAQKKLAGEAASIESESLDSE